MHKKNYIRNTSMNIRLLLCEQHRPRNQLTVLLAEEILERCKQILNCNLIEMILLWVD